MRRAGWLMLAGCCWALACGKAPEGALRVDVGYSRLDAGPDCVTIDALPATGTPGKTQVELVGQPVSATLAVGVERAADWSEELTVRGELHRGACDGPLMATDQQPATIPRTGLGQTVALLLEEAATGGGAGGGSGGGAAGGSAGGAAGGSAGGAAGGSAGGAAGGSAGGAAGGSAGGAAGGSAGGAAGGSAGGAAGGSAGGAAGGSAGGAAGGSAGGAAGGSAGGAAGGSAGGAAGGSAGGTAGGAAGGAGGQPLCTGAGLRACYALDENGGAIANDGSGNGLHGAVSGATWVTGHRGSALAMTGAASSQVLMADNALLEPSTALTVEAWIQPGAVGTDGTWDRIIDKGANTSYALGIAGSKLCFALYTSTGNSQFCGVTNLSTGAWIHVAATWDGATATIFLNGKVEATASRSGNLIDTSNDLVLGNHTGSGSGGSWGFQGLLDSVRIWGVALTPNQICDAAERTFSGNSCN